MTPGATVWDDVSARKALRQIFDAAVASADPGLAVVRNLPERPKGRCVVVGAGKASAAMAAALDAAWSHVDLSGVVVTRYGHAVLAGRIEIIEASHPVPDENSAEAGRRLMAAVQGLTADDLVLALMSGGGSSLLVSPAGRMTLADKQAVNRILLASGATISEMNIVRKRLSRIKGGKLAAAAFPARVVTLAISDVPGDNPGEIGSGPTVQDASGPQDALDIVQRYGLTLPQAARDLIDGPQNASPPLPTIETRVIASPLSALQAAAREAENLGLQPLILGDALEGEAREMGCVMAGIALSARNHGLPVRGPAVLLSGGEGSVTLAGTLNGRGGRNTEFLLGLALALKGADRIWALACDSDGIDGVEDAAGAIVSSSSLRRMTDANLDPHQMLVGHISYNAFRAIGDLIKTGPTLTNVNDIRILLVGDR
ncbi:glycerate kinase type-2 family protein [Rhizobium leguminosarum]